MQKSTGSWYRVLLADGERVACRLRGKFKLEDKKITNPVAVGDQVEVIKAEGFVIQEILPRRNYVVRASPRKKGHLNMIAANVDQALLVTSLRQPRTSIGFIDRFFVTLETFRISGILLINKTDLYDEEETAFAEAMKLMYSRLGYLTLSASLLEGDGADIGRVLRGKTTLVSGHSGTGKSTLINRLVPSAVQKVDEVSDFAQKGVHTTTFAEMFALGEDGFLIDTPGIKELGLAEVEREELSHYFPEMRALMGRCKFHNCMHVNEPGCAVIRGVGSGAVPLSRYESYLSMLQAEDNRR